MTFLITYHYGQMRDKQMRIKNCRSDNDAKYRLHGFLIRKHGNKKLEVVSCIVETDAFDVVKDMFGDIFR